MSMKKITAFLLCAVMSVSSAVPIFAEEIAEEEPKNVVLYEEFADFEGGIPSGFKSGAANLTAEDGAVHIGKGQNLVKELDNTVFGRVGISARVRFHYTNGEGFLFTVSDGKNEYKGVQATPKGNVRIFNGKKDWAADTAEPYKAQQWYDLRVLYDLTGQTVSLYIDGKAIIEKLQIAMQLEEINSVSFKCTLGGMDVDNVEIASYGNGVSEVDTYNDTFLMAESSKAKYKDNIMQLSMLDPSVKCFERDGAFYVPLSFLLEAYEISSTLNTQDKSVVFSVNDDKYRIYESGSVYMKNSTECRAKYDTVSVNDVLYIPVETAKTIFGKSVLYSGKIAVLSDSAVSLSKYAGVIKNAEIQLGGSGESAKEDMLDFSKAESILPDDILNKLTLSGNGIEKELVEVNDENVSFKQALAIETLTTPQNYWDSKIYYNVDDKDISMGDICLISFYARTISSTDESTNAQTEVVFEQQVSPWGKLAVSALAMDGQWRKYYTSFISVSECPAGTEQFNLRLGYKPQRFEIADVKMYNFKNNYKLSDMPVTALQYDGIEDDAQWRKDAVSNIEKNRISKLDVNVVDESGNPVPDANVNVKETKADFRWGTSVSQWLVTGQNNLSTEKGKKDVEMYRKTLLDYFNLAVPENALKWTLWEDGRKENSRMCVNWLKDHGIEVKGHALYWDQPTYSPQKYRALEYSDPRAYNEIILQHIKDMAGEFKNEIKLWDGLNECTVNRCILDQLGEGVIKEWFAAAKEANPDAEVYINEASLVGVENDQQRGFTRILQDMVKNNVDFDGVGLQGHFGSAAAGPEAFLKQLEHFANVSGGKRLMVTEYDMISPDETIQSDFLRDLMIVCYSNANTDGFIMWGHWDSDHWRRNSPTFREDWSIKPAGQAWYRLSKYVWNTNVEGKSDNSGIYSADAYHGEYEVTAEKDGKTGKATAKITQDGKITVTLK